MIMFCMRWILAGALLWIGDSVMGSAWNSYEYDIRKFISNLEWKKDGRHDQDGYRKRRGSR